MLGKSWAKKRKGLRQHRHCRFCRFSQWPHGDYTGVRQSCNVIHIYERGWWSLVCMTSPYGEKIGTAGILLSYPPNFYGPSVNFITMLKVKVQFSWAEWTLYTFILSSLGLCMLYHLNTPGSTQMVQINVAVYSLHLCKLTLLTVHLYIWATWTRSCFCLISLGENAHPL